MVDKKKSQSKKPDQIFELKKQTAELEENWKRALADYKNLEKRVVEEKETIVKLSNLVLISKLLPILDNLEMLEKHVDDAGLKMIINEFKRILEGEGVKEIEAKGREFDPEVMEAIDSEGTYDNTPVLVEEVIRKGYKLHEKLIRPVRVKVGK